MKEDFTPILGLHASQALNFIIVHDDEFECEPALRLEDHKEVFDTTHGTLPGIHTLQLDKTVKPVVMPGRRIPLFVRPKLKAA